MRLIPAIAPRALGNLTGTNHERHKHARVLRPEVSACLSVCASYEGVCVLSCQLLS